MSGAAGLKTAAKICCLKAGPASAYPISLCAGALTISRTSAVHSNKALAMRPGITDNGTVPAAEHRRPVEGRAAETRVRFDRLTSVAPSGDPHYSRTSALGAGRNDDHKTVIAAAPNP